ncbi:MAG: hypothetical protein ACI8ZB_000453 [Desulforhopalus sp.]|jgi:hypothetical protein
MTSTTNYCLLLLGAVALLIFSGCTKHEVDIGPVEIKPIHITIDINVKVDRALDDFFGDLDEAPAK